MSHGGVAMIVETRIFEFFNNGYNGYRNLSELAQAMEISVSQIYRVREGKRYINQKFIVGAIKTFPQHRLDDLFYLAPQPSTISGNHSHQPAITHSNDRTADSETQRTEMQTVVAEEYSLSHIRRK